MGCRGRGYFLFPCLSNVAASPFRGFFSFGIFLRRQRKDSPLPAIKPRQGKLGEVDRIPTLIDRQQAHALAPQDLAQEHIVPLPPAKVSVRMHPARQHRRGILRLPYLRRIRSLRRYIDACWSLHPQRFMRPHFVVFLAEIRQRSLLRPPILRRRHRHFLLQRAMHALVPPVLLGMSRLNPLRHNPQLDPPHRQPRQSSNRRRGKRRSVVSPDRLRQAIFAERGFEDRLHPRRVRVLHRLAAQQIAAVRVADRQRIDALSVPRTEPALEVRAPHPVRPVGMRQWFGVRRRLASLLARHHQPFSLQHLPDRARRRPLPSRFVTLQHPLQLARSPAHMRLPQLQNQLFTLCRRLVRMTRCAPVPFCQPEHSALPIPPQPHVPGFPCDPEALAQLRHGLLIPLILKDKPQLLLHHTARFPWHALCCISRCHLSQCQVCPRSVLSGILPVCTLEERYPPSPPVYWNHRLRPC